MPAPADARIGGFLKPLIYVWINAISGGAAAAAARRKSDIILSLAAAGHCRATGG
jgi:hypothetical protein